jgi:outer membrane protein OmpA-like peptidoglycan-associated protein
MIKKYFFLFALVLYSQWNFAQKLKIKQAESYYGMHRYYDANFIYKELIQEDGLVEAEHDTLFRHAVKAAENTKDITFAYELQKVLTNSNRATPSDWYEFFRLSLLMGDYTSAAAILLNPAVKSLPPSHLAYLKGFQNGQAWKELQMIGKLDTVKLVAWNSSRGDFASSLMPEGVVVSSSRDLSARNWEYDNSNYMNTYVYSDSLGKITELNFLGHTRHDGTACYDSKSKSWIFSKNYDIKAGEYSKTGIFFYNEESKSEIPFPFNSKEYFVAQPFLNKTGDILWFSSDMPGSLGKSDIWYSVKKEGAWTEPVNAGSGVNTFEEDLFPVVNGEDLYFSSEGRAGLGGLDLFKISLKDRTTAQPINLGGVVNSNRDDFSLLLKEDGVNGYLSSNRNDFVDHIFSVKLNPLIFLYRAKLRVDHPITVGLDQIPVIVRNNGVIEDTLYADKTGVFTFPAKFNNAYTFDVSHEEIEPLTDAYSTVGKIKSDTADRLLNLNSKYIPLSTIVLDDKTKEPVVNAEVTLLNKTTGQKEQLMTDDKGNITTKLLRNAEYEMRAEKQGYIGNNMDLSTKVASDELDKNLPIQKIRKGAKFEVENVLYDFGKATLRPESKIELNKIVEFLNDNPTIKVELSSHTDSRGSDKRNQALSQSRAQSCVNYLISQGVSKTRIVAKGYGESQLLNKCKNGVTCDESDHQKNRRTEIKILSE